MALTEAKLKEVLQAIESIKAAGANGPIEVTWPEDDIGGHVLIINNKLFGKEYASTYIDLDNVDDAILNDEVAVETLLSIYGSEHYLATASEMEYFYKTYLDLANFCNTGHKDELLQHASELGALVNQSLTNQGELATAPEAQLIKSRP